MIPHHVFLIDSIGALLAASGLGILLPFLQAYIGLPFLLLYSLAATACCYMIYSFGCYYFVSTLASYHLKRLIRANVCYVVLTIGVLSCYYPLISPLGWAYFVGEIIIMLLLVRYEYKILIKSLLINS